MGLELGNNITTQDTDSHTQTLSAILDFILFFCFSTEHTTLEEATGLIHIFKACISGCHLQRPRIYQ